MSQNKFIIDVGVGKIIEDWLQKEGYEVIAIRTVNPEMEDMGIIKMANNEAAHIITMDKDFGELVFKNKHSHKGVLLLRLEDAVAEEKLAAIQNIIPHFLDKIKDKFAVYQNGRLRIKDL
jgi:predicted nuclease of predicted toxin-antitoxin system